MGMKDWIQSCVPFFLRRKKSDRDVEKRVRKKWTKNDESKKHDGFKAEQGGVAFNVQVPDHSGRPTTAVGTHRPGSSARLVKVIDLDCENRYKADVYRRHDAILKNKSTKIKETNLKKREAVLQRKAKMEEEFRCQSRAKLESKTTRREQNIARLEVSVKGSRGRIRLYGAVRRANNFNHDSAVKDGVNSIVDAGVGKKATISDDIIAYLP